MSQHVTTGWPNVCQMWHPTVLRSVVLKCYNYLAGVCYFWADNFVICCVDMLRLFGWGFRFIQPLVEGQLRDKPNNIAKQTVPFAEVLVTWTVKNG